jgi:hypothetical protein
MSATVQTVAEMLTPKKTPGRRKQLSRPDWATEDWVRMPRPKQRLFGLSRTTIFELSERGLIKSAVIRKPGAVKGIRLVYVPSLLAYLENCASRQA